MDWNIELILVLRICIAAILGGFIGWDRERHGRDAGIRTYAAVALGSCVFGLVSLHATDSPDKTRIASGVVMGIGFLGAGIIFKDQSGVKGLTTAATIWTTASVGLAIAFGMYILGALAALITYFLLAIHHFSFYKKIKNRSENKDNHNT
ncbi:MAG: MgtC/SapB family protein [Cytophagaceae bacterium]|nr:MgtC/SapB family protein [Cytophagaceae bacterium]